jgi:hypothetical protein
VFIGAPAGSEEWYTVSFPENDDVLRHGTGTPTVSISPADPSVRIDILYSACGTSATCGSGTTWSFTDNASVAGAGAYSTRSVSGPTTISIRLYRISSTTTCANYVLNVSR